MQLRGEASLVSLAHKEEAGGERQDEEAPAFGVFGASRSEPTARGVHQRLLRHRAPVGPGSQEEPYDKDYSAVAPGTGRVAAPVSRGAWRHAPRSPGPRGGDR